MVGSWIAGDPVWPSLRAASEWVFNIGCRLVLEVSLATFMIRTPPGVVSLTQLRPVAQLVKGQDWDLSERARFMQERRIWKAVVDAECQRLEVFLRTCTFD